MKIARKISLSFLVTAIILTTVALSIVDTIVKSSIEKMTFEHLLTAVNSRAEHIKTFLDDNKGVVELMSSETVFIEFLSMSKDNPEYDKKLERASSRINNVIKTHQEIFKVSLLNKSGIVAMSTDEELGSGSVNDMYLKAKEGLYIKDIHIYKTTGITAISIASPVLVNKEFLGVVVAGLKTEELFKITSNRIGLGETGEIYLANKDYYMISPSRFKEGVVLKQKVDTVNARTALEHRDTETMSEFKHIYIFKDYRGVNVLGAHAYIPEMQWALLAEIDVKEALAPLRFIRFIFILILFVVPIVAWLIGVAVSRMISGPIHKLHEGTEIIAEGNLDYKVGTNTKDEIGQLSRAFDKMTEDLTERKRKEEELRGLSYLDGLTGVANRRRFDETLDLEWRRMTRSAKPLSLIMCDIDFFKAYNDTYGHQGGDDSLRLVANTLNSVPGRPGDLVARYGGEEYVVILPETDSQSAKFLAEKMRSLVESLEIVHSNSQVCEVLTISLGVATTIPTRGSLPDELISAADQALYEAKKQGRNRVNLAE